MQDSLDYSLPKWALMRWLTRTSQPVSHAIAVALVRTLYGSLAIFYSAAVATLVVAITIAWRHQSVLFYIWIGMEVATIAFRILLLNQDRKAAARGEATRTDLYMLLTFVWALILGYGALLTTASGDFAAAAVVNCIAAAIAGGMCTRYFGAPRFVLLVTSATLLPLFLGCIVAGDPVMLAPAALVPLFLFSMFQAARRLNRMMLLTMEAEEATAHRALHDDLTGLMNRAGLVQEVERRQRECSGEVCLTLFYCDLDDFKPVNDSHGHAAGDLVLRQVAQRLRVLAAPDGLAARVGGDEFVLIIPPLSSQQMKKRGDAIVRNLTSPAYDVGGPRARIGVSIGAATMSHADRLSETLRRADQALYGAKADGGRKVTLAA